MAIKGSPPSRTAARNIPSELNSISIPPCASIAMTPPSPCDRRQFPVHDLAHRLGERAAAVAHPRADVVGHGRADEHLSVSGRRNRAAAVVGIGAGTDDRRIADALIALAGHAAGRGRRRQPPGVSERDRTDGAHVRDGQCRQPVVAGADALELAPALGGMKITARHQCEAAAQARIPRRPPRTASRTRECSITARASSTGFLMWVTPHTAPARSVRRP